MALIKQGANLAGRYKSYIIMVNPLSPQQKPTSLTPAETTQGPTGVRKFLKNLARTLRPLIGTPAKNRHCQKGLMPAPSSSQSMSNVKTIGVIPKNRLNIFGKSYNPTQAQGETTRDDNGGGDTDSSVGSGVSDAAICDKSLELNLSSGSEAELPGNTPASSEKTNAALNEKENRLGLSARLSDGSPRKSSAQLRGALRNAITQRRIDERPKGLRGQVLT